MKTLKKKFPNNAVIDMGTNSIRMLIFRKTKNGKLFQVNKSIRYTKLGEDLSKTGKICEDAIVRNIEALDEYQKIATDYDVHHVYVYATNAMREADNREELVDKITDRFGLEVDVISGEKEALYGFLGVSQSLSGNVLIFDIGGGSTELVLGEDEIVEATSMNLGCVRSSEDYLTDQNRVVETEVKALYDHAYSMISSALEDFPIPEHFDLVGVGGTITTLVTVHKELAIYDSSKVHNAVLTREEIDQMLERFVHSTYKEREAIVGLPESRVDTIIAGTVIVRAILEATGKDSCIVCDFDNMEGAAFYKFIDESSSDWDRQQYKHPIK